jgi:hypothetical protein
MEYLIEAFLDIGIYFNLYNELDYFKTKKEGSLNKEFDIEKKFKNDQNKLLESFKNNLDTFQNKSKINNFLGVNFLKIFLKQDNILKNSFKEEHIEDFIIDKQDFNFIYDSIPFDVDSINSINPSNLFVFYNLLRQGIRESKDSIEFAEIKQLFPKESQYNVEYSFKLAFPKKYNIPKEKSREFWNNLIEEMEKEPFQLLEILDISLYGSSFGNFTNLEQLLNKMLEFYDIDWTIKYLDNFIKYLKWFYKRLLNPSKSFYPFNLSIEDLIVIIDFYSLIIKTKIQWKYKDRKEATNYLRNAIKKYNFMESNNLIRKDKSLEKYIRDLKKFKKNLLYT